MGVVTKESPKTTKRRTRAEYIAEVDDLLAGVTAMDEQMDKDRVESARLKAESARLQTENEAILSRLKAMF